MIHNHHYYRLPDGTEVRAWLYSNGVWAFYGRTSPRYAFPQYIFDQKQSRMLLRVTTMDAANDWIVQPTDWTLDDLEPTGETV